MPLPQHDNVKFSSNGHLHEFKLGLGPCGRTVTRLRVTITPDFLTIRQVSYSDPKVIALIGILKDPEWPKGYTAAGRKEARQAAQRSLHEDGEIKEFVYTISSIQGRISYRVV